MVQSKVLIGVITDEYARRADFYDYYHMLEKPEGALVSFNHNRSPAQGRNQLVEMAKSQNCTHILFIDDDMAYKPDSLLKLLEHDVDIVSALYLSRAFPHSPLAFDLADDEDGSACAMYLLQGKKGLQPIVAAGFGFCLIKMSVFDCLAKPYVRLGELNPEHWCDDIGFFNRVRGAGFQSYVDLDVKCGHMGTMIIWPNTGEDGKWYAGYDTNGEPGIVNVPMFTSMPKYEVK